MTKKEAFIQIVETVIFDSGETFNFSDEELNNALEFFTELKNGKVKNSGAMTENAEALFTSGRSIAGSMRKLVNDGYVEKAGKDPVQYSLTEAGKNYQFEK